MIQNMTDPSYFISWIAALIIVIACFLRIIRIFREEGVIQRIKEDWLHILPYRIDNMKFRGINRPAYTLLCLIYYSAKSVFLLLLAGVFYIHKFFLWDIWQWLFKRGEQPWHKKQYTESSLDEWDEYDDSEEATDDDSVLDLHREDLVSVDGMNGTEFECFCAGLLQRNGFFNIQVTTGSGDQGVDITAEKDNEKWAFQCKRYAQPVGNFAVREVFAGMAFYHCNKGVVITNSTFTRKAVEYAEETGILLWDRFKLAEFAGKAGNGEMRLAKHTKPVQTEEAAMTIDQKMLAAVNGIVETFGAGKHIATSEELKSLLEHNYQVARGSTIPSDYCYNRVNDGIKPSQKPMLFEYLGRGQYRCLGENYPYDGKVYHNEQIVGSCEKGIRKLNKV